MTDLQYGDVKVATTAGGVELTARITAPQPAEYRLRFEIETADGRRVRPGDGEVSARFYLSNQLMYFTVRVPDSVRGENTLHMFADDHLDTSKVFIVPAS